MKRRDRNFNVKPSILTSKIRFFLFSPRTTDNYSRKATFILKLNIDLYALFLTSLKAFPLVFTFSTYRQPVVRVPVVKFYFVLVTEIIGDVDSAVTAFWPAVRVFFRASFAVLVFVKLRLAVAVAQVRG